MNATIAVRRGTPRDRTFALDLGRRVSGTSVSGLRAAQGGLVESAFERLAEYVWTRDHALLIAEDGARPVGFAMLVYDLPDEVTLEEQAFLAYMAVEPQMWRHGVGSTLMAAIEALARERHLDYVSLMVTEDNESARELYRRAGFTTERRLLTKPLRPT